MIIHTNHQQSLISSQSNILPPPQFKIIWMDEHFGHLEKSILKFKSVLFNVSVERVDLNQFDRVAFEKHVRSLIMMGANDDDHVMVITSLSKGKGFNILEILKELKKEQCGKSERIYSCVYSGSALKNPMIQNLCILKYGADFVSSLNTKDALLELESFVAQIYQKSYYPKLMKFLGCVLNQSYGDNVDCFISPTNPLVKPYMVLQEEIERQTLKQQGKNYDTSWEYVPLRKIAHNLHLQKSACISLTNRPLVQQPQFLVMIQTGALNPPHKMHQQGFSIAKEFVENYENIVTAVKSKPKLDIALVEKQMRPMKVVGAFMSPSHDSYIQNKASKYNYSNQRVYNATERLTMCALQTEDDPISCEYPWEASQPKFVSFPQVANTCSNILRSKECPISLLMPKNSITNQLQDSASYLRVSYTCGADLLLRAGARKFDYFEDMLALIIGRDGTNHTELMKSVNEIHGTMPVFYIEVNNRQENGLSSTEVRTCLQNISQNVDVSNSKQRLEQILDKKVFDYILNIQKQ